MTSRPAVSVVVPTYSRPDGLRRCLEALAMMTAPDGGFEVVVVDDGTPGGVASVTSEWNRHDVTLTLVEQKNAGPAAARNHGVRRSRGEIVAFTDDDCAPDREWLAKLIRPLRAEPDLLVGGFTRPLTEEPWLWASEAIIAHLRRHPASEAGSGPDRFLPSNNLACRRDRFEQMGGFDEGFPSAAGEDREFSARWRRRCGDVRDVDDATVAHGHDLSLRRFVRQHFGYGRGSFRVRDGSGGTESRASLRFVVDLVLHPLRSNESVAPWFATLSFRRRVAMSLRIAISQFSVAAGVLVERLRQSTPHPWSYTPACATAIRASSGRRIHRPEGPYTSGVLDYGTLPKVLPTQATVIFDGHCGFCTRTVDWLGAIDRHDRLEFIASQVPGTRERFGLTDEESEDSAWTIAPDGERVGGARAIALAVAVAIGNRAPYVPWKIPRGMWVMGKSYRFVANRRNRLPGATPWCDQHPGSCDPAAS